ncbi:MAG: xanthine dehydrogenase family protein subunit M [Deltaproteobacteria bacterium]|nr:xanthine dehydrogenase family protein subunit M [Deltaproteobacteria bacterium]
MKRFDYHVPQSIEEALNLFKSLGDAIYIAGGTDVMVNIKRKKISPKNLISLRNITALKVIEKGKELKIGSCVTHEQLLKDKYIEKYYTALHDAVRKLGSKQIRNVATIGGNICNAAPSADTACPLLVFDTKVLIRNEKGERKIPLHDFFLGPYSVSKDEGEIVTGFEITFLPPYSGSAYIKHSRREAMDLAIVSVATRLTLSPEVDIDFLKREAGEKTYSEFESRLLSYGITVKEARIAMGVVAPRPLRAKEAEDYLCGKRLTDEAIREASEIASSVAKPRDTLRGEAWYRREMVKVLTRRAILLSAKRAFD